MTGNLFGTDGIRAVAGRFPLDDDSLRRLGRVLASQGAGPRVLIARDTRESGPAIEAQLVAGMGRRVRVFSAGVLPTPGLAYLTRELDFDLGIMISASHNPFADNGIKIFDRRGAKLSAARENRISREFRARRRAVAGASRPPVAVDVAAYETFLLREGRGLLPRPGSPGAGRGPRLALDCANGAAFQVAPSLFRRLGLDPFTGHAEPDGRNINAGCGSTHPGALQELVRRSRAELGLALDGDGDRLLLADGRGRLIEGDHVLFLVARYLRETEPRFNNVVVGTVMSNLGLERALRKSGIAFLRADVGDKHVARLMRKSGAILGGEPSGHVILRHRHSTGDGLLTALYYLKALRHFGGDAAAARDRLVLFPQRTISLRVRRHRDLESWGALRSAAARFARDQRGRGRLLVRYSGTEPVVRVMIEARDPGTIEENLPVFRALLENEIGE